MVLTWKPGFCHKLEIFGSLVGWFEKNLFLCETKLLEELLLYTNIHICVLLYSIYSIANALDSVISC